MATGNPEHVLEQSLTEQVRTKLRQSFETLHALAQDALKEPGAGLYAATFRQDRAELCALLNGHTIHARSLSGATIGITNKSGTVYNGVSNPQEVQAAFYDVDPAWSRVWLQVSDNRYYEFHLVNPLDETTQDFEIEVL